MPICSDCHATRPKAEFAASWERCRPCVSRRYSQALSDYVIFTSEETVETAYGWTNALCVDRSPVEWLCWHVHDSRENADACMADLMKEGRGRFPVR